MKVTLYGADEQGCGYYRMMEPARVTALAGVETEFSVQIPAEIGQLKDGGVHRRPQPHDGDVIVLQRPARREVAEYITQFQAMGIAVVVEIDDDLSNLPPQHPSLAAFCGRVDEAQHWRNVSKACQQADLVTCTSQALADRFAGHGRYAVLPNCIPESLTHIPRASDGRTIGWSGAVHFHPGDMEVTHGGVQLALNEDQSWRFLKIGGGAEIVQQALGLIDRPDMTGPLSLDVYRAALVELDIGIVPLHQSVFNDAKSYLKGIEYAGAGVPFVASPTPEYDWLSTNAGLGILAKDRGRNWKSSIGFLMDDERRQEISEEYRSIARAHFTYEGNAQRWIDAWTQAIANRAMAMHKNWRGT